MPTHNGATQNVAPRRAPASWPHRSQATDRVITDVIRESRGRAERAGVDHTRLWDALEHAATGGKRFRPALVNAAHDSLGGSTPQLAVRVGAAVELLHAAFVIHDDVIDGDDVRRGRLNVSGTFRQWARDAGADDDAAGEVSLAAGILVGDLALAAALRTVATCGAQADVATRLLDLFDEAILLTTAGEMADVRLSLRLGPATTQDSLTMAELKTSPYSFVLPLQAGAVLAGAEDPVIEACGRAGRDLGIAFQLADDLLGVFGDPALTRKSATGDLRTSKLTPLISHAQSTDRWREIDGYLGRELEQEALNRVRRLLIESGSRDHVTALLHEHLRSAQDQIAALGMPAEIASIVTDSFKLMVDGEAA